MKNLRAALFVCMICICCSQVGLAQSVYGSTSLDIDPDSGIVTATCETDVDNLAAEYYNAMVSCVVEDSNNNIVAFGGGSDDSGQGYVQTVVTFAGIPGQTYTAMSAHSLFEIYTVEYYNEDPPQPIRLHYYDDVYDFGFYSDNPETFEGVFDLESPGPETATVSQIQHTANTVAKRIRYYLPDELGALIFNAQTLFSPHCDAVFSSVIGSSYTKINFFESLLTTSILQYPNEAPTDPPPYSSSTVADTLTSQSGRPIRIFRPFYPTSYGFPAGYQESVLTHEGIHHYTGWDDPTVTTNFGITPGSYGTEYISDWIARGCVNQ